jgi:hypothetical protein
MEKELPDAEEVAKRRDEALRRALNTPPQHRRGKVRESTEGKSKDKSKRGRADQERTDQGTGKT